MPSNRTNGRFIQNKTASKNLYDQSQANTNNTTTPLKPTSKPIPRATLFKSSQGDINWRRWIIVLFLFIALVTYFSSTTKNHYNNDAVTIESATASSTKENDVSPYIGNQLDNGSSPLTECFGLGDYQGDLNLTVKNITNSDAIVCLFSTSLGRTIRNEYVQKKSSFTMSNIAQGYYKIRVFYGNDWNPKLQNHCGSRGNFESGINFTEFKDKKYLGESTEGYTHTTITLYSVVNDTKSTSTINRTTFFNK